MTAPTHDTPQKSCVQGALEYMLAKGIPRDPRDVFEHFSVKELAGSLSLSRAKRNEDHGLKRYFNSQSPDLSPVENCWLIPKSHVCKYPHWDDSTLEELIREGWARVSQAFINSKVDEMPDRLQAVLDCHGDMNGY